MQLDFCGDCKFETPLNTVMVLIGSRFVYAHSMAQITSRKRITSADVSPVDDDIGISQLDIYIGYTEELLKTCGRISRLQFLKDDISALRLAVASM